jgi:two-component system sensor histidine kinase PilS (NtrC family)
MKAADPAVPSERRRRAERTPHPRAWGPEAVLDAIELPLVVCDGDGRVLQANRASRELGVQCGEVRDLCCEAGGERGETDCPRAEAARTGGATARERRDLFGRRGRSFEVSCFPIEPPAAGSRAVVQLYRDVTRERDLQDRRLHASQLAAAGKLAAGVAHEIRNPLAAMMNAVSLLRDSFEPDSDASALIEILLEESRRVNRIVGDFLSFARPVGREWATTGAGSLIASTLALVEKDPRFAGAVELQVRVADELPTLRVDVDRIREVLWNLLLNAAQAVGVGGRVAVVAYPERGDSGPGLRVAVEDSGPGIPGAMRERVFAPFETTKPNGTGLGLALAKHIVESHGGSISIGDAELGGARVGFWLPAQRNRG